MKKLLVILLLSFAITVLIKSPAKAAITSVSPKIISDGDVVTINGSSVGGTGFGDNWCLTNGGSSNVAQIHFVSADGSYDHGVSHVSSVDCRQSTTWPLPNPIISWSDTQIIFKLDLSDVDQQKYVNGGSIQVWKVISASSGGLITGQTTDAATFQLKQFTSQPCAYTYSDWSACLVSGTQTRTVISSSPNNCTGNPMLSQSCLYSPPAPPTCTSWTYSDWNSCSTNGQQTRTIISSSPSSCTGGNPIVSQQCAYVPPAPPTCTSWTYSHWGSCSAEGLQSRDAYALSPDGCTGGNPIVTQSCTPPPPCTTDSWSCSDWSSCSALGNQTRKCTDTVDLNCRPMTFAPAPESWQSCTPPPPPQPTCIEDTWSCADWNACSPEGIQTRSCRKTFSCPSIVSAPPATSQYCTVPNRPLESPPIPNDSVDTGVQDNIIKATVKLYCPITNKPGWFKEGSGTVINPSGEILTNSHVVIDTQAQEGCLVGFIDKADDEPYFNTVRQIADIIKFSPNEEPDVALLQLRNPENRQLTYVDIKNSNINNKLLGRKLTLYGYPAIAGSNLTLSSGDLSGFQGDFLTTDAFMEHGNSGGGAYLNNGAFVGIPSGGKKGELNSIGFILSVNVINAWLNNATLSYNQNNNDYSRVSSVFDGVDINNLKIFNSVDATISIYSDKSKTTLLPNNPGIIHTANRPLFQISKVGNGRIAGYYVYFGTKIKIDPVKKGRFIRKPEYVPPIIKQKGTYYFIIRAKDSSGNIGDSIITEYTYSKPVIPHKPVQKKHPVVKSNLSNDNFYTNSQGKRIHSPAYENQPNVVPDGATALCNDGTYSFSLSHRGTCSHHGGVESWLQ